METRLMCGESVSLLGFGCMRLPQTAEKKIDFDKAEAMLVNAYERGVNYFDTAYIYHEEQSEVLLGRALKKMQRDKVFVADKLPVWMVKEDGDTERLFNEQLKRLGVDYIDFYLLHSLDAVRFAHSESMRIYEKCVQLKAQGKIKHLGFSFHDRPEVLERIISGRQWDFAQIQMNYFDWSYMRAEEMYSLLTDKNIPIVVMEPVRGGFLANLSPEAAAASKRLCESQASLALRWVAQYPNVKVILSGMSSMEQAEENIDIFSGYSPITDAENETAQEIAGILSSIRTVPCTGCRYCMDCPSGVDIPAVFDIYNHFKVFNDNFRTGISYRGFGSRQAKSCTGCGACMEHCPQHIDIPAALKNAGETLSAL